MNDSEILQGESNFYCGKYTTNTVHTKCTCSFLFYTNCRRTTVTGDVKYGRTRCAVPIMQSQLSESISQS